MGPTHCLTFDIEEHFQASAFDSPMRRRHWERFESRVERNTGKLLDLLAAHKVRATFFVLGWVAERHPELIRRIAGEGHEVASHGYAHQLISSQTKAQFKEDVRKAKAILENLIAAPILGYRAPSYTVTQETRWARSILAEEGYLYDSSIFANRDRANAFAMDNRISTSLGPVWAITPRAVQMGRFRIPMSGGLAFRLCPYFLLKQMLKSQETNRQAALIYLSVWELDPAQPRMNGRAVSRFQHYVNLHKVEQRLRMLLQEFQFAPIREAIPGFDELRRLRNLSPAHVT